jgi:carboxypeptidase PM20D1
MKRYVIGGLVIAILLVATVVVVRTVRLSFEMPDVGPVERETFDRRAAAERLSRALQFQTISYRDPADLDPSEFEGFISFLEASYPRMHDQLEWERVNTYTVLYRWIGQNLDLEPGLIMGHYDVVPVEETTLTAWTYPPYSGAIEKGFIWGRGAIDDKSGTVSQFEAVEQLLERGYQPERTLYIVANHDEESGGEQGAGQVANLLKDRGISLAFLVDEGLPLAEEIISGIESPLAMIGIADKGQLTVELSITREGGHASMPPRETAIGELARAIRKLKDNPMPGRFGGLVQSTFDPISAELPFIYRAALSNLWLFRPLIERRLSAIPHTNAALRTTIAPTMFQAGIRRNVLPAHANAVVNFRIHPNDDVSSVLAYIENTINNPAIDIRVLEGARNPSVISNTDADSYNQLKRSIWETFGEVPIAPSIFVAASDSRYFLDLTNSIYRFRPIRATPDDRNRIHGTDERIGVENYEEMIHFQIRLIKNTTGSGQ